MVDLCYSNLFPSGNYLIWSLQLISAACCTGASVSACADLTNQLQCCWVDPAACTWIKHWHSNCRLPVDGGGGTPRPVLLTGAKKDRGAWLASSYCMGFQNFLSVIKFTLFPNKKKKKKIRRVVMLRNGGVRTKQNLSTAYEFVVC